MSIHFNEYILCSPCQCPVIFNIFVSTNIKYISFLVAEVTCRLQQSCQLQQPDCNSLVSCNSLTAIVLLAAIASRTNCSISYTDKVIQLSMITYSTRDPTMHDPLAVAYYTWPAWFTQLCMVSTISNFLVMCVIQLYMIRLLYPTIHGQLGASNYS